MMLRRIRTTLIAALLILLLLAAPDLAAPVAYLRAWMLPGLPEVAETPAQALERAELAAGLAAPRAVALTGPERLLIGERRGRVRLVVGGQLAPESLEGGPPAVQARPGGLRDLIPAPDYDASRHVYISYVTRAALVPGTAPGPVLRVDRFRDDTRGGGGLVARRPVFALPLPLGRTGGIFPDPARIGGRMAFGLDGMLYLGLGDFGHPDRAQDRAHLAGSVLRLDPRGRPAPGNPFIGRAGLRSEIYSYGHRAPRGVAVNPATGRIWLAESGPAWRHAPGGGDEINRLEAAGNYGWPEIHHRDSRPGMRSPEAEFTPGFAPRGAAFHDGVGRPAWRGHLFVASAAGRGLYRLVIEDGGVAAHERLLAGEAGALADIAIAADGTLYVLAADRLLRLTPAAPAG